MIQANCMQIASGWAFDMTLNTSRHCYLRRDTVSQIFEVQPSAPFQQSLTGHLFQKVLCLRFHLFIHGLANLRAKQNHRPTDTNIDTKSRMILNMLNAIYIYAYQSYVQLCTHIYIYTIISWSWESQDIASKAHRQLPFFTCFHIERVTGSSVQGMPVSMPVSVV